MNDRITVWVQQFNDRKNLMLQWTDPETGKRTTRSARTADPKLAEKARADLEYELNNGMYGEPSKLSWQQFREMFTAVSKDSRSKSATTTLSRSRRYRLIAPIRSSRNASSVANSETLR